MRVSAPEWFGSSMLPIQARFEPVLSNAHSCFEFVSGFGFRVSDLVCWHRILAQAREDPPCYPSLPIARRIPWSSACGFGEQPGM
jgi:hypothetical protein